MAFSGLWRSDRPQVCLLGVSVGEEEESELELMDTAFVHPRMGVKATGSPWRRRQEGLGADAWGPPFGLRRMRSQWAEAGRQVHGCPENQE